MSLILFHFNYSLSHASLESYSPGTGHAFRCLTLSKILPYDAIFIINRSHDAKNYCQAQKISLQEYFSPKFVLDRDGIYLQLAGRSGFFLPSVAQEFGYNKLQLLETLCQHKVGLSSNCYQDSDVQIQFMEGSHFTE